MDNIPVEEKVLFQTEATITKVTTVYEHLRLYVDTQELSPEMEARIFNLRKRLGYFTFNVSKIEPEDI
ncbi:MAG: hypothetical protein GY757_35245, partial [bacterium]|nr:hypothetical protein [bacterium]